MTPSTLYRATNALNIQASSKPRPRWPLQGRGNIAPFLCYAFDQDFQCALASAFPPPDLNTPSSSGSTFLGLSDANAILTKVSQPQNAGDGQVKFTGSFARVPASWDEFTSQNVTFPGFDDFPWVVYSASRSRVPKSRVVTVRRRHDYFVVDPGGLTAGVKDSGGGAVAAVASAGAIPTIYKNEWLLAKLVSGTWTPISFAAVPQLTPINGFTTPGSGVTYYHVATVPSIDHYLTMCATAAALSGTWTSVNPPNFTGLDADVSAGQFVESDSKLVEYEGQIWDRVTTYALMQ